MSARYTPVSSGQVSDFEDFGLLIPHVRLVSDFCSSNQCFASGFLQIPPHGRHPCRAARSSPCRACRGLQPPGKCALPGAPKIMPRRTESDAAMLGKRGRLGSRLLRLFRGPVVAYRVGRRRVRNPDRASEINLVRAESGPIRQVQSALQVKVLNRGTCYSE